MDYVALDQALMNLSMLVTRPGLWVRWSRTMREWFSLLFSSF